MLVRELKTETRCVIFILIFFFKEAEIEKKIIKTACFRCSCCCLFCVRECEC